MQDQFDAEAGGRGAYNSSFVGNELDRDLEDFVEFLGRKAGDCRFRLACLGQPLLQVLEYVESDPPALVLEEALEHVTEAADGWDFLQQLQSKLVVSLLQHCPERPFVVDLAKSLSQCHFKLQATLGCKERLHKPVFEVFRVHLQYERQLAEYFVSDFLVQLRELLDVLVEVHESLLREQLVEGVQLIIELASHFRVGVEEQLLEVASGAFLVQGLGEQNHGFYQL